MTNERRLVDADGLLPHAEQYRCGRGEYSRMVDVWYIENAPTVDAVEVVRCRECKHYRSGKPFPGTSYCARLPYYAGAGGLNVGDEDYCSSGERREEPQRKETNGV